MLTLTIRGNMKDGTAFQAERYHRGPVEQSGLGWSHSLWDFKCPRYPRYRGTFIELFICVSR